MKNRFEIRCSDCGYLEAEENLIKALDKARRYCNHDKCDGEGVFICDRFNNEKIGVYQEHKYRYHVICRCGFALKFNHNDFSICKSIVDDHIKHCSMTITVMDNKTFSIKTFPENK